jgi:hypothetical protein
MQARFAMEPPCGGSAAAEFLVAASERRSVRRHVRIDCEVVRERGFKLLGRSILDLSTTGLRVAALDQVLTGEKVVLSFRAPGSDAWIDAEGRVTRMTRGRRASDAGPSIAVQFAELPDESLEMLRHQLAKYPPVLPCREQRIDWAASVRSIAAGAS